MSIVNTVKVACIGHVFIPKARPIIEAIAPEGFELLFAEKPSAETDKWLETSDFLFVASPVDEDMILRAPKLRLIHKWGIGVDKIDLDAAERHGVYVAITAGANAATVSEHTILLMLSVLRRLTLADRAMHEGRWIRDHAAPGLYTLDEIISESANAGIVDDVNSPTHSGAALPLCQGYHNARAGSFSGT